MYKPSATEEVKGVIIDGQAWAGIRSLTPTPPSDFEWNELSDNDGYPAGACGIAVSDHNNMTHVEVVAPDPDTGLTTVYETDCDVVPGDLPTLTCDNAWTKAPHTAWADPGGTNAVTQHQPTRPGPPPDISPGGGPGRRSPGS
ncbi:hypothetical protein AB0F18_00335 [Streptomyces sp. NPDC029216]|uniref:hypothetical protein n=1 Tax=Streptomyces sp. NPDC029216 TaxID=3154701 RepID=UPI00340CF7FD